MFLLRNVSIEDLDDLYELSGKVFFINLPHDKKIIKTKILSSLACFSNEGTNDLSQNYYFFVLEDTTAKKVIGASMIHAQHGTEHEPHFFLRVSNEHKYSQTINTGFVHGTLKLGIDTNGPSEIGGLVLHPDYRGNPKKLGKQISFIRFLYMALHKDKFKETVLSELMPPLDSQGNSPLWEAIGRRFMNMDYSEADKLSRSNKEFILSLFPAENIYMTLLPFDARNSIGKVGADTMPVKSMLEKIGFKYVNEVDPFDGGPHYKAKLSNIKPIQNFKLKKLAGYEDKLTGESFLISFKNNKYPFVAIRTTAKLLDNDQIILPKKIWDYFDLTKDCLVSLIPF